MAPQCGRDAFRHLVGEGKPSGRANDLRKRCLFGSVDQMIDDTIFGIDRPHLATPTIRIANGGFDPLGEIFEIPRGNRGKP